MRVVFCVAALVFLQGNFFLTGFFFFNIIIVHCAKVQVFFCPEIPPKRQGGAENKRRLFWLSTGALTIFHKVQAGFTGRGRNVISVC